MVDASWQVMEALGINKSGITGLRGGGQYLFRRYYQVRITPLSIPTVSLCIHSVLVFILRASPSLVCASKKLYLVVCMSLQDATVIWEH